MVQIQPPQPISCLFSRTSDFRPEVLFFCEFISAHDPAKPGCHRSCESRKISGTRGRRPLVQIHPPQPNFLLFQSLPQTLQPSEFVCRTRDSRKLRPKTLPVLCHNWHDVIDSLRFGVVQNASFLSPWACSITCRSNQVRDSGSTKL